MSEFNVLDVYTFPKEFIRYDREKAKQVLARPIPPALIKTKPDGLRYVETCTCTEILDEAFEGQWSFQILEQQILPSANKYDKVKKQYIPQPPTAQVKGRLIILGWGVAEQFGSHVLEGGASQQEHCFKSAASDCLKKCASRFGFAKELYQTKNTYHYFQSKQAYEASMQQPMYHQHYEQPVYHQQQHQPYVVQSQQPQYQAPVQEQTYQQQHQPPVEQPQQPVGQASQQPVQTQTAVAEPPAQQNVQPEVKQTNSGTEVILSHIPPYLTAPPEEHWTTESAPYAHKLRDLKPQLGIPISKNDLLNPYCQKFFRNKQATWEWIRPSNAAAVIKFLEANVETARLVSIMGADPKDPVTMDSFAKGFLGDQTSTYDDINVSNIEAFNEYLRGLTESGWITYGSTSAAS